MTMIEPRETAYMPDAATALATLRFAATSEEIALTPEGFALALRDFLAAHDADLIEQMLESTPDYRHYEQAGVVSYEKCLDPLDIQAFADRRRVQL
jgi:hypothetical protein